MQQYCDRCGKEVETKIVERKETFDVMGEGPIEVDAQVLTCIECGNDLFCEKLDDDTLTRAYDAYRRKHNLLFPEDIRQIRESMGLAQEDFAKLLGWEEDVVRRYENGSIQSKLHNRLLMSLSATI